jgi:hypothetical protein
MKHLEPASQKNVPFERSILTCIRTSDGIVLILGLGLGIFLLKRVT